jgi:hypothetical protein
MKLTIKISHNEFEPRCYTGAVTKCLSKNSDYIPGRSRILTTVHKLYNLEQRTLLKRSRINLEIVEKDHIWLRYRGLGQPEKNI